MTNILYMEDDPGIAHLVTERLKTEGYQVEVRDNGYDGLEILKQKVYDLVLLDFHMPGMSGIDVLKQLSLQQMNLPVIMLTGAGNEMVAVEAMRNNAIDYVVKDTNLHFLELLPIVIGQAIEDVKSKLAHKVAEMSLALERERAEIINSFITKATHEFRTPLSIIKTALYFLNRQINEDKLLNQVGLIDEQTTRINKLVDNLIIISRLDALDSLDMQAINMELLLGQIVEKKSAYSEVNIHLEVDDGIFAKGDEEYLDMALEHVIDNAIRFNRNDGDVTITATKEHSDIVISIEDSGIGMSQEDIPKMFERFYRLDESHSTPGFGLGMSISQRIIELHHGDIYVESELDKGTRVIVTLVADK